MVRKLVWRCRRVGPTWWVIVRLGWRRLRRYALLPDVGYDCCCRREVGVLVQDGQVVVQRGDHYQVVCYGQALVLAFGGKLGLDVPDGFPTRGRAPEPTGRLPASRP